MASTEALNILVITFNCARHLLQPDLFAKRLSKALPDSQRPDIILVSLQEFAPIAYCFLGGSYLAPYFQRFQHAIHSAGEALGGAEYANVITRNLGMTACMVSVLEKHQENIQWIETGGVGVGLQEMGNKGAVGVRLGYGTSNGEILELTFVAAHLAPMEEALQRRNEDWQNIVRGLVFTPTTTTTTTTKAISQSPIQQPVGEESEPLLEQQPKTTSQELKGVYTSNSHLILAGDLNYRTSSTRPQGSAHLIFPKPNSEHHDNDDHFHSLLQNDQLSRELQAGRTCHGLSEAPIDFPPSYKYSKKAQRLANEEDTTTTWDWAKHRWPSWCDRILYLDLPARLRSENPGVGIEVEKYTALPLMPTSDHRPVVLAMRIPLRAIPTAEGDGEEGDVRSNPPFDINPWWRERRLAARRKEIAVGILAYLVSTWVGRGILLVLVVDGIVGWYLVKGILG
ncbi:MAG: hypothetical protein Q9213_008156 [Squamulea squamosa]